MRDYHALYRIYSVYFIDFRDYCQGLFAETGLFRKIPASTLREPRYPR
jgi:hypothetical protein